MNRKTLPCFTAVFVCAIMAARPGLAQKYDILDLGARLGTNSYAYGINNQGQVVGYWQTANGARAFLYSGGTISDLGSLGGTNQYALNINASGQVVGFANVPDGIQAFLHSNGSLTNLGPLGGVNSYAYGINDGGKIVGFIDTANGSRAFIYGASGVTNLGTLGGTNSYGFGVNNSNLVVGAATTHTESGEAFLWQGGAMTNLNEFLTPGTAWDLKDARGINRDGKVVGWGLINGQEQAFLFDNGQVTGIGWLPNATNSYAFGINDSNQVVGAATLSNGLSRAFLWADGTLIDLNSLLPEATGWDLREARGINDRGDIVGWGVISNQEHAFILSNVVAQPILVSSISEVGRRTVRQMALYDTVLAPEIISQPSSQTIVIGSNLTFSVAATGTEPLSYQWMKNGVAISGATSSEYSKVDVQPLDCGSYSIVVTNIAGTATSASASLKIKPNAWNLGKGDWIPYLELATNHLGGNVPSVVDVPSLMQYERLQGMQFLVVKAGDGTNIWGQFSTNLVDAAHATGLAIFAYGRVRATDIEGEVAVATNALALGADGFVIDAEDEYETNVPNSDVVAAQYCQGIRDAYPDAFLAHAPFPYIFLHTNFPYVAFGTYCDVVMPQCYWRDLKKTVPEMVADLNRIWNTWQGTNASNAIKPIAPAAQGWGSFLPGAEITEFVERLRTNPTPASVGGYHGVSFWRADLRSPDVWNGIKSAEIGTVEGAPLITNQPSPVSAPIGTNANFSVIVSGTAPFSYQWRFNGIDISGATGSTFTRTNVQVADMGMYSVLVSNAKGMALSQEATLSVTSCALWTETFESGLGNWTQIPTALTNSSTNHTMGGTNSAKVGLSSNKMFRDTNYELAGNSKVTLWIYDSDQSRAYGEVRAYSGAGYGYNSGLQQILGIGRYSSGFGTNTGTLAGEIVDINKYQGRVYAGTNTGWFNLNAFGAPSRSVGWHKFEIIRSGDGTTIQFYVDGLLGRTIVDTAPATWDSVTIGSVGSGTTAGSAWFDDVSVEYFEVPVISEHPSSQTVTVGSTVTLNVAASGNQVGYQWRLNGIDLVGETESSLVIQNFEANDVGSYTAVISNGVGVVISSNAAVNLCYPPRVRSGPSNRTVNTGTQAVFQVEVDGAVPITYQWIKDGTNLINGGRITGANSNELTIRNICQNDAGHYSVALTNTVAGIVSPSAVLSVNGTGIFKDAFETDLELWSPPVGANALTIASHQNPVVGNFVASLENSRDKIYHDLQTEVSGRSRATFWIFDDFGPQTRWYGEVRAYSGACFNSTLEQVLAIGNYKLNFGTSGTGIAPDEVVDPLKYQGRVGVGTNAGWFNLNGPASPGRVTGWHKFEIERSADGKVVTFYVDGAIGRFVTDVLPATWDTVTIGSYGASSGTGVAGNAWFDDVSVDNLTPIILDQPVSRTCSPGTDVSFSFSTTGTVQTLQWQKNGVEIAGATNSTLSMTNVQISDEATYSALVVTATDREYAASTLVIVTDASISSNPVSQTIGAGSNTTFTVECTGNHLRYQWLKNGNPLTNGIAISGANSPSLVLKGVSQADTGYYSVSVTNFNSSVASSTATLTVIDPPVITQDLCNQTVNQGATAILRVGVTGSSPLTYRWLKNGHALTNDQTISGSTTASLTISNLSSPVDVYCVNITNLAGATKSSNAVLLLNHLPLSGNHTFIMSENTVLTVSDPGVLSNASDLDGNPLTALLVREPMGGIVSMNSNGSFTYTPRTDFNGIDYFSYTVSDGFGTGQIGIVSITVNGTNNPPRIIAPPGQSGFQNFPLRLYGVSIDDPDAGTNEMELVLSVTNGCLSVLETNGLIFIDSTNGVGTNLVIRGTLEVLNVALSGLSYVCSSIGTNVLTLNANDLGNTGIGGVQQHTKTMTISVKGDPSTITNLRLWLRADAGVQTNASNRVASWTNQAISSLYNASQIYSNYQPTLDLRGINGKPVIHFNASLKQWFNIQAVLSGSNEGAAFFVLRAATNAPTQPRGLWHTETSRTYNFYPNTNGTIWENFGSTMNYAFAPSQVLTDFHIHDIITGTNEWNCRINGITQFSAKTNYIAWDTTWCIGRKGDSLDGSSYFDGDIAEILVFSSVLSAKDRDDVTAYLAQKYALFSAPSAPSNLTASAISATQISLKWNSNLTDSKTRFQVERSCDGDTFVPLGIIDQSLSFIDTDASLAPGTRYYYRVKAIGYPGESFFSNVADVDTLNGGTNIPVGNLRLWLKGDAGRGDGKVNCWLDQSRNGNHAHQQTLSNQPGVFEDLTIHRPAVHFSANSNTYFEFPAALTGACPGEAFFVLRATTNLPSSGRGLWMTEGDSVGNYYPRPDGKLSLNFGSSGTYVFSPSQSIDRFHLQNMLSGPNEWSSRINGITQFYTNVNSIMWAGAYTANKWALGRKNGGYFDGDIAELMLFDRALSPDERVALERYVFGKYHLLTNLFHPPTISSIPTQVVDEDCPTGPIAFTIRDDSTPEADLKLTIESDNLQLVPLSGVTVSGNGSNRTVSVTPAPNQYGQAHITITVTDCDKLSAFSSFVLVVEAINDPPSISVIEPSHGQTFVTPKDILVSANASDIDGYIKAVSFFSGTNLLATVSSAPFSFIWSNAIVGSASITAVAQDEMDAETASTPISVSISRQPDSDYDGNSDLEEQTYGTDPYDSTSYIRIQLAKWSFDQEKLFGDRLQIPIIATNVHQVQSWAGSALNIASTNIAELRYLDAENDGHANINLRTGSIRLWFKPNWSSSSQNGSGPGDWAYLINVGNWTSDASYGCWLLSINPLGDQMYFVTQTNGAGMTNLSASISWSSGIFHEIVVVFDESTSSLYVDGQFIASGAGVTLYPALDVRQANGLNIGSSLHGGFLAQGQFDEIAAFNYVLSANEVMLEYETQRAIVDSDIDGLSDLQENAYGTSPANPDSDTDGMPDGWEVIHNLNPVLNDAGLDSDFDGVTNVLEYLLGRNPCVANTRSDLDNSLRFEMFTPLE